MGPGASPSLVHLFYARVFESEQEKAQRKDSKNPMIALGLGPLPFSIVWEGIKSRRLPNDERERKGRRPRKGDPWSIVSLMGFFAMDQEYEAQRNPVNLLPSVREKIPWEGEFTFRSDS